MYIYIYIYTRTYVQYYVHIFIPVWEYQSVMLGNNYLPAWYIRSYTPTASFDLVVIAKSMPSHVVVGIG